MPRAILSPCWLCLLWLAAGRAAPAAELVTLERDGERSQVAGELVVEAADGGVMLLAADGVLWSVPPEELIERIATEEPFAPLSPEELSDQLVQELPAGFAIHRTTHYLICYNTSKAYAQWCGGLFERLYRAFTNYWSRRGFELTEPRFPLVAVVFADGAAYRDFSRAEVGEAIETIIGYYSLRSNRMTMYDLTGIESLRRAEDRRGSAEQINRMLARPEGERLVATIIHEATHQIAFNCGLQTRYADIPLWLSEGIALYFETPDLRSSKGWRNVGGVNQVRLAGWRDYAARRPEGSLASLLSSDAGLRDPRQAADAYSEAWALTYFLIRQKPAQFARYLKMQSAKQPLLWDNPETRLLEFQQAFGEDLDRLDAELQRHMAKVR